MPSACPGFATYQELPSGQIQVSGSVPVYTSEVRVGPLVEAWAKYGRAIYKASKRHSVPIPWLVGIMMAESKGNSRACSPCSACKSDYCESAAGKQCCAFGLMQFIGPTARRYGLSPEILMNNPSVAVDAAARLVSDLGDSVGVDIVRISAAYNGGINKCGKEGTTFGWYTNDDYPMVVVTYLNTFIDLGLPVPSDSFKAGFVTTVAMGAALLLFRRFV